MFFFFKETSFNLIYHVASWNSYDKRRMNIEEELAISATEGMIKKGEKVWKDQTVKILGLEREAVLLKTFSRHTLRRRQWHPTPVLLPGKSHGRRSLVGCSPWDREESDMTERLHFHFSLFMHWRRKWQPTPVFLPGESQGWSCTELDTTEVT